jgi:ADP-ribosylglycohydrolase
LPVESWPSREIRRRYPKGIREINPDESQLPWDDDVAQTVILAEAILEHDTLRNDDLAARLMEWFESNGRGMGSQTRAVINALRQGMLPSEAARLVWERDGGPAGNGAVMRCAPVAMRWPHEWSVCGSTPAPSMVFAMESIEAVPPFNASATARLTANADQGHRGS